MDNLDRRISTHHGPETRLSRLAMYRLKQAGIRRDAEIQAANARYTREVEAILGAAPKPPPLHAIANTERWSWHIDVAAFARRLRGKRPEPRS